MEDPVNARPESSRSRPPTPPARVGEWASGRVGAAPGRAGCRRFRGPRCPRRQFGVGGGRPSRPPTPPARVGEWASGRVGAAPGRAGCRRFRGPRCPRRQLGTGGGRPSRPPTPPARVGEWASGRVGAAPGRAGCRRFRGPRCLRRQFGVGGGRPSRPPTPPRQSGRVGEWESGCSAGQGGMPAFPRPSLSAEAVRSRRCRPVRRKGPARAVPGTVRGPVAVGRRERRPGLPLPHSPTLGEGVGEWESGCCAGQGRMPAFPRPSLSAEAVRSRRCRPVRRKGPARAVPGTVRGPVAVSRRERRPGLPLPHSPTLGEGVGEWESGCSAGQGRMPAFPRPSLSAEAVRSRRCRPVRRKGPARAVPGTVRGPVAVGRRERRPGLPLPHSPTLGKGVGEWESGCSAGQGRMPAFPRPSLPAKAARSRRCRPVRRKGPARAVPGTVRGPVAVGRRERRPGLPLPHSPTLGEGVGECESGCSAGQGRMPAFPRPSLPAKAARNRRRAPGRRNAGARAVPGTVRGPVAVGRRERRPGLPLPHSPTLGEGVGECESGCSAGQGRMPAFPRPSLSAEAVRSRRCRPVRRKGPARAVPGTVRGPVAVGRRERRPGLPLSHSPTLGEGVGEWESGCSAGQGRMPAFPRPSLPAKAARSRRCRPVRRKGPARAVPGTVRGPVAVGRRERRPGLPLPHSPTLGEGVGECESGCSAGQGRMPAFPRPSLPAKAARSRRCRPVRRKGPARAVPGTVRGPVAVGRRERRPGLPLPHSPTLGKGVGEWESGCSAGQGGMPAFPRPSLSAEAVRSRRCRPVRRKGPARAVPGTVRGPVAVGRRERRPGLPLSHSPTLGKGVGEWESGCSAGQAGMPAFPRPSLPAKAARSRRCRPVRRKGPARAVPGTVRGPAAVGRRERRPGLPLSHSPTLGEGVGEWESGCSAGQARMPAFPQASLPAKAVRSRRCRPVRRKGPARAVPGTVRGPAAVGRRERRPGLPLSHSPTLVGKGGGVRPVGERPVHVRYPARCEARSRSAAANVARSPTLPFPHPPLNRR